ncbi:MULTISPECIES: DUF6993 domain-containing protein [unclassified Curtobacterium]|uniref:DUF6993 domain-containing protein n=1 Tax=unclassified Curtobacterium TaxID=257496 RepID=UPI0011B52364|nr:MULTISPECIES: hypothetical protein [unclassified Curtobacterium]WIB68195.1 hypothetical protein DEI93_03895 [Curtobacterium sp. MCBD17_035]
MRGRLPMVLAITMLAGIGVSACTGGGDHDTVSAPPSSSVSASTTATAISTPTDVPVPTATMDAAAIAAKGRFDDAAHTLTTSNAHPDDAAIVNSLVNAGFPKKAMQITPDTTSIGRAADSIQVSVLVGSTCLIGQFRGAAFVSETAPVLSTGKCLIGKTESIQ